MFSISHNNLFAKNSNLKSPLRKKPEGDYSTLPNNTIVEDLDDLFLYIESQCYSPLLNENIKSCNSHAIDNDFVPLQVDQDSKLTSKRYLLPEFECEQLKYTFSRQTSTPLQNDLEELLDMSDFMDEDGTAFTTYVLKGQLDVVKSNAMDSHQESYQAVLPTRRCLLQEFDATTGDDYEVMTNTEEDDYGSECSNSFDSGKAEKETSQYCSLDNEVYKHCTPWYLEDFTNDI